MRALFVGIVLFVCALFIVKLGCFLNLTVMSDNNGLMPVERVSYNQIEHSRHSVADVHTKFKALCDRYSAFGYIWSLGDFLILGGIGLAALTFPLTILGCYWYDVHRKVTK